MQNWIEKGAYNLSSFLENTGKLLTFTEVKNKHGICIDLVTHSWFVLSIKKKNKKKMHA